MDLTFFGLTLDNVSSSRVSLFSQIHEIVFHGKGGYDWDTVYNMPIWLRKFTFNKIKSWYDGEKEAQEKAQSKSSNGTNIDLNSSIKPKIPQQAIPKTSPPSYTTKASKK